MQKLLIFSLILLSGIMFFLGLNWGKHIERIDSPVQTKIEITKIIVTKIVTPTLEITKKPNVLPTTQTPSDIQEVDL